MSDGPQGEELSDFRPSAEQRPTIRVFDSGPGPLRAVPVFLVINAVVFLAWMLSSGYPSLRELLSVHFLVSSTRIEHGLVWTLVTAAFSHYMLVHLLINMVVLVSFASPLERLLGARKFVGFYLLAAIVSSASHCAVSTLLLGDSDVSALGASGAVAGVLLAFALLYPHHRILLFGIIPLPALLGALAFVALDLWGLIAQGRGGGLPIGHGAHLGGALTGALFYAFYLRPRRRRVMRL
ncbi:MAG: rhomboid family intramembrane serine protease [Acidobacteriota bacterium]|nr:MAG: rhomboid family intramembrane serine protease [Acidobacteriota bacterium]